MRQGRWIPPQIRTALDSFSSLSLPLLGLVRIPTLHFSPLFLDMTTHQEIRSRRPPPSQRTKGGGCLSPRESNRDHRPSIQTASPLSCTGTGVPASGRWIRRWSRPQGAWTLSTRSSTAALVLRISPRSARSPGGPLGWGGGGGWRVNRGNGGAICGGIHCVYTGGSRNQSPSPPQSAGPKPLGEMPSVLATAGLMVRRTLTRPVDPPRRRCWSGSGCPTKHKRCAPVGPGACIEGPLPASYGRGC